MVERLCQDRKVMGSIPGSSFNSFFSFSFENQYKNIEIHSSCKESKYKRKEMKEQAITIHKQMTTINMKEQQHTYKLDQDEI